MPKKPRLTPQEAEKLLLDNGYEIARIKGSHKIFQKGVSRMVIPFHSQTILHPKIIKQLYELLNIL